MNFNFIYLHGFASGPETQKGLFFKSKISESFNSQLLIPDLNLPSFERLSINSQIDHIHSLLKPNSKNILIGSSLGGLTALLCAQKFGSHLEFIFPIATAVNLNKIIETRLSKEDLKLWENTNQMQFHHHYFNEPRYLHYEYFQELNRINYAEMVFKTPCVAFHGIQDEHVPIESPREFFKSLPHCKFIEYDTDHQMLNYLNTMWIEIKKQLKSI
jgi:esterase/lipase